MAEEPSLAASSVFVHSSWDKGDLRNQEKSNENEAVQKRQNLIASMNAMHTGVRLSGSMEGSLFTQPPSAHHPQKVNGATNGMSQNVNLLRQSGGGNIHPNDIMRSSREFYNPLPVQEPVTQRNLPINSHATTKTTITKPALTPVDALMEMPIRPKASSFTELLNRALQNEQAIAPPSLTSGQNSDSTKKTSPLETNQQNVHNTGTANTTTKMNSEGVLDPQQTTLNPDSSLNSNPNETVRPISDNANYEGSNQQKLQQNRPKKKRAFLKKGTGIKRIFGSVASNRKKHVASTNPLASKSNKGQRETSTPSSNDHTIAPNTRGVDPRTVLGNGATTRNPHNQNSTTTRTSNASLSSSTRKKGTTTGKKGVAGYVPIMINHQRELEREKRRQSRGEREKEREKGGGMSTTSKSNRNTMKSQQQTYSSPNLSSIASSGISTSSSSDTKRISTKYKTSSKNRQAEEPLSVSLSPVEKRHVELKALDEFEALERFTKNNQNHGTTTTGLGSGPMAEWDANENIDFANENNKDGDNQPDEVVGFLSLVTGMANSTNSKRTIEEEEGRGGDHFQDEGEWNEDITTTKADHLYRYRNQSNRSDEFAEGRGGFGDEFQEEEEENNQEYRDTFGISDNTARRERYQNVRTSYSKRHMIGEQRQDFDVMGEEEEEENEHEQLNVRKSGQKNPTTKNLMKSYLRHAQGLPPPSVTGNDVTKNSNSKKLQSHLDAQLEKLNTEIAAYQQEREALEKRESVFAAKSAQLRRDQKSIKIERKRLSALGQAYREETEKELAKEKKKIKQERREMQRERQLMREVASMPNRKDRAEVDSLKATIIELRKSLETLKKSSKMEKKRLRQESDRHKGIAETLKKDVAFANKSRMDALQRCKKLERRCHGLQIERDSLEKQLEHVLTTRADYENENEHEPLKNEHEHFTNEHLKNEHLKNEHLENDPFKQATKNVDNVLTNDLVDSDLLRLANTFIQRKPTTSTTNDNKRLERRVSPMYNPSIYEKEMYQDQDEQEQERITPKMKTDDVGTHQNYSGEFEQENQLFDDDDDDNDQDSSIDQDLQALANAQKEYEREYQYQKKRDKILQRNERKTKKTVTVQGQDQLNQQQKVSRQQKQYMYKENNNTINDVNYSMDYDGNTNGKTRGVETFGLTTHMDMNKGFEMKKGFEMNVNNDAMEKKKNETNDNIPIEITHPDGKTEVRFDNGRRVIKYRNGTVKDIQPNGESMVTFTNGDVKQTFPPKAGNNTRQKLVVYYYALADTTHSTYSDGLEVFEFPNKQIEYHYPTGRKEIHYADGTKKTIYQNGDEESLFPDGTKLVESAKRP
eukprot:g4128.t1